MPPDVADRFFSHNETLAQALVTAANVSLALGSVLLEGCVCVCVRARLCATIVSLAWGYALVEENPGGAGHLLMSVRACLSCSISDAFASNGLYVSPEQDYDTAASGTTQAAGPGGGNLGMEIETERDGASSQTQRAHPDALPLELGDSAGHRAGSGSGAAEDARAELQRLLATLRAQIHSLRDDVRTVGGWGEAEEVQALREIFGPAATALRRIRLLDQMDRRLISVVCVGVRVVGMWR